MALELSAQNDSGNDQSLESENVPCQNQPACESNDSSRSIYSINERTSRLVEAIENGRHINFIFNEDTGNHSIFASDSKPIKRSEDGIERQVADADFGHAHDGDVSPLLLDADSLAQSLPNKWGSLEKDDVAESHHEAKSEKHQLRDDGIHHSDATAKEVYVNVDSGHPIRNSATIDESFVNNYGHSPIPLDYHKQAGLKTPSIHSSDSEEDCSSPLFFKSFETITNNCDQHYQSNSQNFTYSFDSSNKRVISWMNKNTQKPDMPADEELNIHPALRGRKATYDRLNSTIQEDGTELRTTVIRDRYDLGIWQKVDERRSASFQFDNEHDEAHFLSALKKVKQPGYLQYNSFAQSSKDEAGIVTNNRVTATSKRAEVSSQTAQATFNVLQVTRTSQNRVFSINQDVGMQHNLGDPTTDSASPVKFKSSYAVNRESSSSHVPRTSRISIRAKPKEIDLGQKEKSKIKIPLYSYERQDKASMSAESFFNQDSARKEIANAQLKAHVASLASQPKPLVSGVSGSEALNMLEKDPVRSKDFAFTLGRLEGRLKPRPSSPIPDRANLAMFVGDEATPHSHCEPRRLDKRPGIRAQFLKAAKSFELSTKAKTRQIPMAFFHKDKIDRPTNPTPDRARNRYGMRR